MKILPLLFAAALSLALPLRADVSPIHMTVDQDSKSTLDPKDKSHHSKTQTRSLRIQLDNNSTDSFDGLVVKYWFFGHSPKDHAAGVLSSGERKSSLAPRGRDVVESEVLSKHYVEEHTEVPKGGKGGKPTKVPASGDRITGYAVRVMKGDKVLAETYSEPSYKALAK